MRHLPQKRTLDLKTMIHKHYHPQKQKRSRMKLRITIAQNLSNEPPELIRGQNHAKNGDPSGRRGGFTVILFNRLLQRGGHFRQQVDHQRSVENGVVFVRDGAKSGGGG